MELIENSKWTPMTSNEIDLNFALDLIEGLGRNPKSIPSKYLYDQRGSDLFNKITELPEYYVTNTEKEILKSLHGRLNPYLQNVREVIEFGGGDGSKAEILLEQIRTPTLERFVCVDISGKAAQQTTNRLRHNFSDLEITPYVGDYFSYFSLIPQFPQDSRLFLYLGSNIGNFEPDEALRLLSSFQEGMSAGDYLLIGFDLKKEIPVMTQAYNDSKGITAEFNLNILDRINRELGGRFNKSQFFHHEFYNPLIGAMQSFLISNSEQSVIIEKLHKQVHFDRFEPLHIENSFKYTLNEIKNMAEQSGFDVVENFMDEKRFFTDSLWKKA